MNGTVIALDFGGEEGMAVEHEAEDGDGDGGDVGPLFGAPFWKVERVTYDDVPENTRKYIIKTSNIGSWKLV